MSKSQFTESDLIPNPLPIDLNGRPTTREQWEYYSMELRNHKARIERKRHFLNLILEHCEKFGVENTRESFTHSIDMESSMDRPNEPGYYRAAND